MAGAKLPAGGAGQATGEAEGLAARPAEGGARARPKARGPDAVPEMRPAGRPADGAAVVLDRITVRRGNRLVFQGLSAEVPSGSFVGLVGPNGCGKTTLLQVILGLIRAEAGSVRVLGADPARCPWVRRKIGYVAQIPGYDPLFPVSAADVVEMGALARAGVGDAGGNPALVRPRRGAKLRDASMRALRLIGLEGLAAVPFGRLSGGQRQLVLLARAIAGGPRLLLLDEPLTGLDQQRRAGFYPLVDRLRRETGMTVIAVCHDFRALLPHAGRLLCLDGSLHEHIEAGVPPPGWTAPGSQDCLVDAVFQGRFPAG